MRTEQRGLPAREVRAVKEQDAWWLVARSLVGAFTGAAFRMRVTGVANIPRSGGALLAYNHVSVLDAIFVGMPVVRRDRIIRCFALSEDFERPLLGRALRGLDQVPIRRGAGVWSPLEELADIVRKGGLAGIAPEGTVGTGDELLPIQKGAARIALLAGAPVIPVGLWGPQRRWPKTGLHYRRPARPAVGVAFGAPIHVAGDPKCRPDVQSLTDRLGESICAQVALARRLAPDPA
ncbi:MAG: lysophospholipid acyltransferase family protein [Actinomycetota bacterium]